MLGLEAIFRWLHIFVGILWIGHLYYFNFVNGQMVREARRGCEETSRP